MDIFSETVERIERAYENDFEYRLGWRFLYTPVRTLSVDTNMLLVGIDPGGTTWQENKASVEEGNAYHCEYWERGHSHDQLQVQVQQLFRILAAKLDHHSAYDLMDQTMTSNMFPIRTGGWSKLRKREREKAIEFSRKLWSHMFDRISPKAIVCLGKDPYQCFRRVLTNKGFKEAERSKEYRVGWHNDTYSQCGYERGDKKILMVGLPHLTRRKIFSNLDNNSERREAVDRFTEAITHSLKQP